MRTEKEIGVKEENDNNESTEINFDADISQLMNLIINSFYSKKEIFLRELLSNASDALEKIRYESLTDKEVLSSEEELKIRVWVDKESKELVISDTGVGMTRYDIVHCLGTIASSGTKRFLENVTSKDVEQIGQFGVGFYSSYLVADSVKLYTKHNNDKEYIWESTSDKTYKLSVNNSPKLTRGTEIHLSLKEDEEQYLDINNVKETIKRYTEFISYPIEVLESREIEVEEEEDPEDEDDNVDENVSEKDEPNIEDINEDEVEKQSEVSKKNKVKKTVTEWKVLNDQKPIWSRKPEDVSDDEYKTFYKKISNDYTDAITHKHFHTEGQLELDCLLYIPERPPMDMFEQETKKKNIKLYVKKVFIMDDCEDLLPEWLKFLKGVVDSNDIPLNVSREILQQNKVIKQIKNTIVKKTIELITELSEDEEKYKKFYDNYGKMIKLGIHEDSKNRDKLIELLRFNSANNSESYITLNKYVENMSEDDKSIYYITGENKEAMSKSPFIERIRAKGNDVLYFTDAIDEYMIQNIKEYKDKKLVDVSKEGIKFDEEELSKKKDENKNLMEFIKEKLGDKVTEVRVSDRLDKTPCVLVTAEFGWTANMERIMKAQALRNNQMDQFMGARKIMEINPDHKIMKTLRNKLVGSEDNKKQCGDIVLLLFDTTLLNSGFSLEKPSEYANKVNRMIEVGFCDNDDDDHDDDDDEKTGDVEYDNDKKDETENSDNEDSSKMEEVD
tara:strand:+ start:1914 stop:4103 length:2190 start_codon:yes stop_codon:yes gene_type:complete